MNLLGNKKVDLQSILDKMNNEDLVLGYKDSILQAVNYLCDMIKVTLGAKGKTVMFRNKHGKTVITKDGVTVARQCNSTNPVEQMVIEIVREASEKTVKTSGDGTTTTAILAQYLINRGYEHLKNGASYYDLAIGIDDAVASVVSRIESHAIRIDENSNFKRLLDVATVSSNSKEIGDFVFDIMKTIGIYGAIEIKKSSNTKDRIDKVTGIKFNKGFYAPQFVNDVTKMQWKAKDVAIVLYDDTLRTINDIMPYIDAVGANGSLLIAVNDVEPTILQTLINNRLMNPNDFNIMIVEHDGFGDRKTEIMNDIAAMTGATISTSDNAGVIGFAKEVIVDADTTSILEGEADQLLVDELITITKNILNDETLELDDDQRLYYKRRLATLAGGVAVIHVGGATEVEMNEKKDRIEDAVEAVKAAINKGVVIGGGYEFLRIQNSKGTMHFLFDEDKIKGSQMVYEALSAPFEQLCINAGVEVEEVLSELLDLEKMNTDGTDGDMMKNKGYDAITNTFVPLDEYRVYDPASVLTDALNNAAAVAKSILSIERVIGY